MKRLLLLVAVVALALPATALAKGPDEATITGPGLGKAITITGAEELGSPIMTFAEATGFFPAVFGQDFSPMLPSRPKGDLGPKYTIDYNVPGGDGNELLASARTSIRMPSRTRSRTRSRGSRSSTWRPRAGGSATRRSRSSSSHSGSPRRLPPRRPRARARRGSSPPVGSACSRSSCSSSAEARS